MRTLPNAVLDTVVGGVGDAGFGLGGSSGIQTLAPAPASSSSDLLGSLGETSARMDIDMANGISPLSGRGW